MGSSSKMERTIQQNTPNDIRQLQYHWCAINQELAHRSDEITLRKVEFYPKQLGERDEPILYAEYRLYPFKDKGHQFTTFEYYIYNDRVTCHWFPGAFSTPKEFNKITAVFGELHKLFTDPRLLPYFPSCVPPMKAGR